MSKEFENIVNLAHIAGHEAACAAMPEPMTVVQRDPVTGKAIQKRFVPDGACGFAWVKIRPATSKFARWGKKQGLFGSSYGGGLQLWVSDYNQSVDRKSAYASAYAKALREHGINAYADSRLD